MSSVSLTGLRDNKYDKSGGEISGDMTLVGADNTTRTLKIVARSGTTANQGTTGQGAYLRLEGRFHSGIMFDEDVDQGTCYIRYNGVGMGDSNYLAFGSHHSGWVGEGSGFNYIPSNGRVGLGTTAPDARLHVVGDAIITGGVTEGGVQLVNKYAPKPEVGFYALKNETPSAPTKEQVERTVSSFSTISINNSWKIVRWVPGFQMFVAVSNNSIDSRIRTSSDGQTWVTRVANSTFQNVWDASAWSRELNMFVAVTNTTVSSFVLTSTDGISWSSTSTAVVNRWRDVVWSSERQIFVAVSSTGTGNRVMTSTNGTAWTTRASAADEGWISLCYGAGRFIAGQSSYTKGMIMTSANGTTSWTTVNTGILGAFRSICYSEELGRFVAMCNTSNQAYVVCTSSDGLAWTSHPLSVGPTTWNKVIWVKDLSLFIAISGNTIKPGGGGFDLSILMTSPDGISWTTRTHTNNVWNDITWSPELGMLVMCAWGSLDVGGTGMLMWSNLSLHTWRAHAGLDAVLNNGGRVGIGVSAPTRPVHIRGAAPYIRIHDTQGSGRSSLVGTDANGFGLWVNNNTNEESGWGKMVTIPGTGLNARIHPPLLLDAGLSPSHTVGFNGNFAANTWHTLFWGGTLLTGTYICHVFDDLWNSGGGSYTMHRSFMFPWYHGGTNSNWTSTTISSANLMRAGHDIGILTFQYRIIIPPASFTPNQCIFEMSFNGALNGVDNVNAGRILRLMFYRISRF